MDFKEKYQDFTTPQLIEIVTNREHYQPQAVEAAQNELNSREVDDHLYAEMESKIISHSAKEESQNIILTKLNSFQNDVILSFKNLFNPKIKSKVIDVVRIISIGMFVFAGMAIYKTFKEISYLDLDYHPISIDQIKL